MLSTISNLKVKKVIYIFQAINEDSKSCDLDEWCVGSTNDVLNLKIYD